MTRKDQKVVILALAIVLLGVLALAWHAQLDSGVSGFTNGYVGGGIGGSILSPATIMGPMRIPTMNKSPLDWFGGIFDHILSFLVGCSVENCVQAGGPVGGGGGGGYPSCNTCNMSGPPGTTPGGGGGWVRKAFAWNWFNSEQAK